jgi:hypothetical protein
MKLEQLERNLLAAARGNPPSQEVPYCFEKRVMAHLQLRAAFDEWAFRSKVLWQAAAPCVGLMLLLIAWSWFTPAPKTPSNDLSLDLENTLLTAAAEQDTTPPAEFFW